MAKKEAEDVLFICNIIRASQCLVLNRESKESRKLVQEQIIARIKDGEDTNKYDPIIIHPEGGTTNGKHLINFKGGAFRGLNSVFPKIHKQYSWFQQPSSGIMEGLPHYLICSALPFSWLEITWLPVFKPNDYFFEHHQREGEEKWLTYSRVIRDIMAEVGGYTHVNESIEDKFEYKKILFPKKFSKESDAGGEA